jgi:RNA polymerase sigma-70 factor (ECF subfamily)
MSFRMRSATVVNAGLMTSTTNYEELVSPHLLLLSKWVRGRVPRKEDADDVIQQTLLLALRHMDQFRFEASFSTWLCRIAINVIRARIRSPEHSRMLVMDPQTMEGLELRDPRDSALAALQRRERHDALYRAISHLPEIYRTVVELRDLRGFSLRETARILRLSNGAIKSRHHRARGLLLRILAERGVTGRRAFR